MEGGHSRTTSGENLHFIDNISDDPQVSSRAHGMDQVQRIFHLTLWHVLKPVTTILKVQTCDMIHKDDTLHAKCDPLPQYV